MLARGTLVRRLTNPLPWAVVIAVVASTLVVAPRASAEHDYRLLVSRFADRTQAVPVDGQSVGGRIYVFTSPDAGVSRVLFYVDDPERTGSPYQIERQAPYDLAGTAPGKSALPFDTAQLPDGVHTITASVERSDGVTDVLHGELHVANATPALVFSVDDLRFSTETAGSASRTTHLATNDGIDTDFAISTDAGWVTAAPASGTTPSAITVSVDATGLGPGVYEAAITASAPGYVTDRAFVTLSVSNYSILVSSSPDRSAPAHLAGRTVGDDVFVFTAPDTNVKRVLFYVDDPDGTGKPYQIERREPFDLAGTAPDGMAFPFDTNTLDDGVHVLTAAIDRTDGETEIVHSNFTVHNSDPALFAHPGSLDFSITVGGNTAPQSVEVLTSDGSQAPFTASTDADWLKVSPTSGDTPADLTVSVSAFSLAAGTYHAAVNVAATGFADAVVGVTLTVHPGRCGPLDCSKLLVELPYELDFDSDHDKILDRHHTGTGFTYLDRPSKSHGYLPQNLEMNDGALEITTTPGLAFRAANSQDNALGVGIRPANQVSVIGTTILDVPAGTGQFQQAGLWFGNDEDNYVKLVVLSNPGGTLVEFLLEVDGWDENRQHSGFIPSGVPVELTLRVNPVHKTIRALYAVDGGDEVALGTFSPPNEFFSFDGARIDPTIGTDSFAGVFASHRNGSEPLVYRFDRFSVLPEPLPPAPFVEFPFERRSHPIGNPTAMVWGPDDRLYVTELFGRIRALTFDDDWNVVGDQHITTLGSRLTLGITVDPASTPENVILWVSHSNPSIFDGAPNTSTITKLSGPGFLTREDVITGLPRAKANHAVNHIHFGPDGRLYIAAGGNTGAGAPNDAESEFGDMEEQPLSAALLVADVFAPGFEGDCHNPEDIFGPPPCDVAVWASGLRNMYDFTFHTNGRVYGPDNGLGVTGTFPPSPEPPCTGMADPRSWLDGGHNPGAQPDWLHLLEEGRYYGHPNPYRDECVFYDGHWQDVDPLPNYTPAIASLGDNKSANGTIEYLDTERFDGKLAGQLLIANYSVGDDITRVKLSDDGRTVVETEQLVCCFADPLPLQQGPGGVVFVGEFGGGRVTVLVPDDDLGTWDTKAPMPEPILDAGGTALDGKLYSVAGKTSDGPNTGLRIYDPATDSWTTGPDMPGVGVEDPAAVALDGKLYTFGGSTGPFEGAVASAAAYDPSTNAWTDLAPMPTARGQATAQAMGGVIYVAGGMGPDGASLDDVEVYDPVTDTWSQAAPMLVRRDNAASAAIGGKLYVFGGRTRDAGGGATNALFSTEMYDPQSGQWTERAPMPTARRTMVTGILGGKVLVVGGEGAPDGSSFAANEEYDPVANQWTMRAPIPTPRHGAVGGVVDDVFYVAGGGPTGGTSFTDVTEAFFR